MKTEEKALRSTKQSVFEKTINFFKQLFNKKDIINESNIEEKQIVTEREQFNDTIKIDANKDEYEVLFERLLEGEITSKDLTDFQIMKVTEICEKRTNEINMEIAEKSRRLQEVENRINNYVNND